MRVRHVVAAVSITALCIMPMGSASAIGDLRTIVTFDASTPELPEGLAIDKRGVTYVSLVEPVGEIRRITPWGEQSVLTHFDVGGLGPLGMAVDARGTLYVGLVTFDPATQGVYRIEPTGDAVRVPGSSGIGFANGLAFDDRGNLFVTDSTGGAVWRIPPGGEAQLWVQDPLLEGTGALGTGFPVGANGIVYEHNTVIVANTEHGTLVEIPVSPDRSPGEPRVIEQDAALFGADGLALDARGTIYAAIIAQSTIVRVDGDEITTLADADGGINQASSITFGTGRGDRTDLYLVNFGVFSSTPTPALLRMTVGVPGMPLP
jgi:sugar lactone lactonase YvrE